MPNNFLSLFYYVLAIAIIAALGITVFAFTATIFVFAFLYVFIPLFIIAAIRWLWMRFKYGPQKITYYDSNNHLK